MKKILLSLLFLLFSLSTQAQFLEVQKQYLGSLNLLKNPGFESGKANWSSSGGVVSTVTSGANLGFGNSSLSWDSDGNAQTLTSAQIAVPAGLYNNTKCSASFFYKTAETTLTFKVIDGSFSTIAGPSTLSSAANFKSVFLEFTCPTSGTLAIRITSAVANSAIIYLDNAFLGLSGDVVSPPPLSAVCSAGCSSSSNLTSGTTATYDLGSSSDRWQKLWVGNLDLSGSGAFSGDLSVNGNTTLGDLATADTVTLNSRFASNLIPSITATDDLGSSALRWQKLWVGNVDASGSIVASSSLTAGTQVLSADGSAATPSVSLTNAATSGLYKFGANSLGFSSNGLTAGNIDSSQNWSFAANASSAGKFLAANGAAATPSIVFTNSNTTGFYRSGADILGFSTAGVSAGTIDASQNWSLPQTLTLNASSNQFVIKPGANKFTLTGASPAADRIYTIPDAGGAASFVMTAGAQTLAGVKTFSSAITASAGITASATNDTAGVGIVGEPLSQSRLRSAATGLTSGVAVNVTASALSLTAGEWRVCAMVGYTPGATTSVTQLDYGISTTSVTFSGADTLAVADSSGQIRGKEGFPGTVIGVDVTRDLPCVRVSLSGTTSYFLVAQGTFTVSTLAVYGSLFAFRPR